ncbi:MAG: hypothetical protein K1X53_03020 [Candidatus Sumerlaeaceae bacterium]|nr:hypothetical protein [Candidatus Sumerlaeaceae bacterium]
MNRKPVAQTPNKNSRKSENPRKPTARWKLAVFALVPLVLLMAIAEVALRLAGYGGFPSFFVPYVQAPESTLLRYDTDALWPYFSRRLAAGGQVRRIGSNVPERVLVPKPKNMVRVVMVGESSVQGFPYPPNLCAASFLEKYLQALSPPGKKVEVLNTGITAVASYPLRKVVAEACKLTPDLLIIYAGHNEFFGAFGVASAQGVGTRTWQMGLALALRSTAIFQGILSVVEKNAAARMDRRDANSSETLMELMGTQTIIGPESPLRQRAEQTLSDNLDVMLDSARKAGVPVVLCSVAANERDFVPVKSVEPGESGERAKWKAAFDRAMDATSSGPRVSLPLWEEAARLCPENALSQFYLGRMLDLTDQHEKAREAYRKARDLDGMPWRAPTDTNDMMRRKAAARGIPFVDVDGAFHADAEQTNGSAPGWRLFADHVHPSLEGQALMARAMADTIRKDKLLELTTASLPAWSALAADLGDNRLNQYRVAHLMASLFQRPPLNHDADAGRHARSQMAQVLAGAADFEKKAAEAFVAKSAAGEQAESITMFGGRQAMAEGKFPAAAKYFASASQEGMRFSPQRSLAEYYELLCERMLFKTVTTDTIMTARARLVEASIVEQATMPSRERDQLLHAMTGLALLANDVAGAKKWAAGIPDSSPEAPAVLEETKAIEAVRQGKAPPVKIGKSMAPGDAVAPPGTSRMVTLSLTTGTAEKSK